VGREEVIQVKGKCVGERKREKSGVEWSGDWEEGNEGKQVSPHTTTTNL
jgi:hypothetical protein